MAEKHLSIEALSERLDVPVVTLYQWNYRKVGPRYMKIGRYVRYRLADVERWEDTRYADRERAAG